jgi:hypothetical protein
MKPKHLLILAPVALLLIAAAATSRDLVIQSATDTPGVTIIKPGSQTSNLLEVYVGSALKGGVPRAGGYLFPDGSTQTTAAVTALNTLTNGSPLLGGGSKTLFATNAAGARAAIGAQATLIAGDNITIDGTTISASGGGETVWTNSAGIVTPAGGQALTNRLQFVSGAADNATNVAVVVDTKEYWDEAGAALVAVRNFGTNVSYTLPLGGTVVGPNAKQLFSDWYSRQPDQRETLVGMFDLSKGEGREHHIRLEQIDYDDTSATTWFDATILSPGKTNSESVVTLGHQNGVTSKIELFNFIDPDQGDDIQKIELTYRDVAHVSINPTAGASGTAHYLGTAISHTSGSLAAIANNGTSKVSFAFDGATTIAQSADEPAAPAAGYFTLFATNNAGKMVLKVRFPTGASQTIATEP